MDELKESLERQLQRSLLEKFRILPSIPQSPSVGRMQQNSQITAGSSARPQLPSSPAHLSAPTLPPAGAAWRLEDDKEVESGGAGLIEMEFCSPFSYLHCRAAYLQKGVSINDQLRASEYNPAHSEGRSFQSSKGKLKRKSVSKINIITCFGTKSFRLKTEPDLIQVKPDVRLRADVRLRLVFG
ncbi:ankyrin repeat and fibronectin type-III domain-containing protein 1-like [Astyanax mexicanus]|uniref:Ankyrin repeat and fibronectin type-III domain-containing protein 1-like n=1 Tax=Astyanax mexicanus TaxID=7994 RepID=A0A8T2LZJ9_ASTMX|nr:ankyrin repeat and fibronectin type-III domain-containing protein 1-like [Astyanax mexicanus]